MILTVYSIDPPSQLTYKFDRDPEEILSENIHETDIFEIHNQVGKNEQYCVIL